MLLLFMEAELRAKERVPCVISDMVLLISWYVRKQLSSSFDSSFIVSVELPQTTPALYLTCV